MSDNNSTREKTSPFGARSNIVLIGFLAIATFYLLAEHRAHVFGALPWLLLLACPLMHLFMHHGHGGHGHHSKSDDNRELNR